MTKEQLWQLWCDSDSRQKFAAYEVLTGKQGRPQYPLTEDSAICRFGWHPYEDDSLTRRLYSVAQAVRPYYLPTSDITLIAAAGYQLGKADGKRAERARKKASERLEAVHADLNNYAMGRSAF